MHEDGLDMTRKKKILLVDDHPVVREGLTMRIQRQPDLTVCGEADGCREALAQIDASQPDLVVVDLVLQDGGGLQLIHDIRSRHPHLAVLALSVGDERIYARRALEAGARGYMMKVAVTEEVVAAIRQILDGHVYVSPAMQTRLLDSLAAGNANADGSPDERLTNREVEVFRLLGAGLRTREIATRLHLSIKTVETYCERIKASLGLSSFPELLREAILWVHSQEPDM
jgi:DNA-binding NarL/FixJ family response regulator